MTRNKLILSLSLFILLGLSGCISLAEDITPPPGAELPAPQDTQPPETVPVSVEPAVPAAPPDPTAGEPIYAEKCAPCHGTTGLGDGPDSAMLTDPVPALGTPSLARQASPAEWFTMVTQGNMQKFMPPFTSLSDQQRWDVVAYAFTLSTTPEMVAQGQSLFQENCAECHGPDGTEGVVDLTNQAFMSERSASDIFTVVTTGKSQMHEFGQLSEDERWALADYLRAMTFANFEIGDEAGIAGEQAPAEEPATPTEVSPETPTEEVTQTLGVGNIYVNIFSNSNAEIPTGLEVTLRGYDEMTEVYTQTLTTEGASLTFEEVPFPLGRIYFVTTEYQNAFYGSDIVSIDETSSELSLDIEYYPPTTDPSILNVDRLHIFVDFISEETIEVFQLYIFSNPTNQVLVPEGDIDTAVNFTIPSNAANFNVQEDMTMIYHKTDDGFGIANIYPSDSPYQTLFSFEMAYPDRELDLKLPVGLDANAVIVMAPANGVKVESDQLVEGQEQTFEGVTYKLYNGSQIAAGDELEFTLSGKPKTSGTNIFATGEDSGNSLVIGLAGFGAALLAAGIILWRRNQITDDFEDDWIDAYDEDITADDIMDAIITLDDQYKNGDLPEGAYQSRRRELKERLKELMN